MSWFVDSIDRRAGIAFAVETPSDLYSETDERAICFIAPPDFEPQPIASRALALGASKQGAEPGVLVDGVNVAFGSLSDIVEFVRRGYGASGGGDGGGDDGPPPTPDEPRPEEPRPERPAPIERRGEGERYGEGERSEARGPRMIVAHLRGLLKEAESLVGGDAFRLDWSELTEGGAGGTSLQRPVGFVFDALMLRVQEDGGEKSTRWRASFTRFCNAMALIGFSSEFAIEWLVHRHDLLGSKYLRRYLHWRHEFRLPWHQLNTLLEPGSTPFDTLCALPVPAIVQGLTPRPFEHLGEFLAFACGSSDWVRSSRAVEIAELLYFCAAVVAATPETPHAFPIEFDDRRLLAYRESQARKAAARWLAQNLPQAVFGPALERLITQAARDRAPV